MNAWRKRTGRWMTVALAVLLLAGILPGAVDATSSKAVIAEDVVVTLDGEALTLSDPARKLNDKLFLPVTQLARLLGAKTAWDKTNEEATITTAVGDRIVFGNGVPVVYFNDNRYTMEEAPFMAGGRMYAPLRQTAELLHTELAWNEDKQQADLVRVSRPVVTEERDIAQISDEYGVTVAALLARNGLESEEKVKRGAALKVVMPDIFNHAAAPYTEEDYLLLAKITQVESGYESYEGQLAVANVVLNRVKSSKFPNSIKGVIYQGKQFPPAHNGLLDKSKPNASVLRAAKDALNGKNNIENALFFYNPKVSKGAFWSSLTVVDTIGNHRFASY